MKSSSIYDIVWEGKFFNVQLLDRKIEISSWMGSSTSDVRMATSAFEWGVLRATLGWEILPICDFVVGISTCDLSI